MSVFSTLYGGPPVAPGVSLSTGAPPPPPPPPGGFADVEPTWQTAISDAFHVGFDVRRLGARQERIQDELGARERAIFVATGQHTKFQVDGRQFDGGRLGFDYVWDTSSRYASAYEASVEDLRRRYPEQMAKVETRAQLQDRVAKDFGDTEARAAASGAYHPVASFVGGTGAALVDPVNITVAVATAGVGELPLLARIGAQSAIWGTSGLAQAPFKMGEAKIAGGPAYTLHDALNDAAMDAFGGALGEVGGTLFRKLIKWGWSKGIGGPEDPVLRGGANRLEQAGLDHGALGARDGEGYDAGLDSLQRGDAPPLGEPDRELGDLFRGNDKGVVDYRGRPIQAASFDPASLETDAKTFQYKDGGDAHGVTDRLRGVAEWDPTASGKVIVWEDPNGRLVVADGHQRLGLARRLEGAGVEAKLDGYLLRASDGWEARDVRVLAALKNIREGGGTALDAAKVFRDAPTALRDRSLPITGDLINQARGLAKLSAEAFGSVVNKVVPERYGAEVGLIAGEHPELHADMVRLLHAAQPANVDEARALVHEALHEDWLRGESDTGDLFGDSANVSAMIGRAKVAAAVQAELRRDARLFGQLVKNADAIEAGGNTLARDANQAQLAVDQAALGMLSKLALRSSPVGEALAAAAGRVASGESATKVARDVLGQVRAALAESARFDAMRAEALDPQPPSAGALEVAKRFDNPDGPGVTDQVKAKPEEAHLETPTHPHAGEPGHDAVGATDAMPEAHGPGLFDDIPEVGAEARAHQRLLACAPGV